VSAIPSASASAAPSAAPSASATASASAEAPPVPDVKLENIGMHLGGTSNTAAVKEPVGKSVEPHFPEFKACWRLVADKKRGGDFGVDLLIEADGGKAKVSNVRTSLRGDGFEACMMHVFEAVDFRKPATGKTMASYSLRFTP
jgi:hypothetical protein